MKPAAWLWAARDTVSPGPGGLCSARGLKTPRATRKGRPWLFILPLIFG